MTLPARGSSRGSSYLELYGSIELGDGVTLGLHAGRQVVRNYESLGFRDYRVSLGKELAGVHAHPRLHEHDRR